MIQQLTFKNFFSEFYIIHIFHGKGAKYLSSSDQKIAFISSFILGLFSLALVPLACLIAEKSIKLLSIKANEKVKKVNISSTVSTFLIPKIPSKLGGAENPGPHYCYLIAILQAMRLIPEVRKILMDAASETDSEIKKLYKNFIEETEKGKTFSGEKILEFVRLFGRKEGVGGNHQRLVTDFLGELGIPSDCNEGFDAAVNMNPTLEFDIGRHLQEVGDYGYPNITSPYRPKIIIINIINMGSNETIPAPYEPRKSVKLSGKEAGKEETYVLVSACRSSNNHTTTFLRDFKREGWKHCNDTNISNIGNKLKG